MTQHSQNGEGVEAVAWSPADWRNVAKLAGEHGVRYRTNSALQSFVAALPRQSLAREPATAATTPPDELARIQLLADVELHLQSVRIFLTKREKMHPCGVDLHDELQARVTAAINEGKHNGQPVSPPDQHARSRVAGHRIDSIPVERACYSGRGAGGLCADASQSHP